RLVRLLPAGNRIRRQVETELGPFWRDRVLLVRVAVASLAFHLTQVGVQYVLARAVGVALPFSYCLVYHPVISLMTALPLSVAGLGVREGGYLYFLTRIDVDDSIAVTLGLLWFALPGLAWLVGGALFVASGAALPCGAVTDRAFAPRARLPLRPAHAAGAGSGGAGEVPFVAHLRHAAEHEAAKAHRRLALGVPVKDVRHARGAE